MKRENLTKDILLKYLQYLPEEGVLLWKAREGNPGGFNTKWENKVAGSMGAAGYIEIKLNTPEFRGQLKAHSIIYFLETGVWASELDHKDQVRHNNKFTNLRETTKKKNALNQKLRSTNTTGHSNISIQGNKFVVQKSINGVRHFKRFNHLEEAIEFRDNLNKEAEKYVNSI